MNLGLKKIILKSENFPYLKPLLIGNVLSYSFPLLDEIVPVFSCPEDFQFQSVEDLASAEKIYVAIDTQGQDAFGHWFFESAIWVPEIIKSFSEYRDKIEFLLLSKKKYKEDVLDYLGVTYTYTAELPNICIVCPPVTSLNLNQHSLWYSRLLEKFIYHFESLGANREKTLDYLLMPRQQRENLQVNERRIDTQEIEAYFSASEGNHKIFNSDQSPGFDEQCRFVRSARTLFVIDGSAFLVNGFIARNSTLVVLGSSLVPSQATRFEKISLITRLIESFNSVVFISSSINTFTYEMVRPFLNSQFKFLPKQV
jgi:hypothetical protein